MSSQVPWIVRGRLPLRGYRGPGPVRASVFLSRVRSQLPYTSTGLLRQQRHITIRTVTERHVTGVPSATEVAVHAVLVGLLHWGPPCNDDPVSTVW